MQYSIKLHGLLPTDNFESERKQQKMDQARSEQEQEIVTELTTKNCGRECQHCEHTEACNPELHFRQRFCGMCRVSIFNKMMEWQEVEFARKSEKAKEEGTQEFMSTGRMYFTNPPGYEYVHINTNKKFTSNHSKLEDAVTECVANPDRNLSFEEQLHKNLKIRCEERAKVFVQVYLGGKQLPVSEMKMLKEKYARIDKYSSDEFAVICDTGPRTNTFI